MVKRILVACIFVPILLIAFLLLPSVATAIVVAFIASAACFELLRATSKEISPTMKWFSVLIAALIPLGDWMVETAGLEVETTFICAFILMVVLFIIGIRNHETENEVYFKDITACLFGGVLIPVFLSSLVYLRMMDHGKMWVLLPFVVAFICDGGAYFAGVFLGKHRGVTCVSPNKSLEGYIGGLVTCVVACLVYGLVMQYAMGFTVNYVILAVYGVIGGLMTELGDLAFSLIKRQVGIKDYGKLLPGHGGMLDRFGSMVFAAPCIFILVHLFPAF